MAIDNLPSQYSKRYTQIDYENVMYLFDYHPWNEGHNPRIDKITHTILNTKSSSPERRRIAAANYFSKVLTSKPHGISNLTDGEECYFAIVPSHTRGCESAGLMQIALNVSNNFNFVNEENILFRHTTVPKAATGGRRSRDVHLESILVTVDVEGETVFLFDDITTTGSSILACKELLIEAGAACVVMIALGQTYQEE
jgi:predicted amidophosphoribosyltransferase